MIALAEERLDAEMIAWGNFYLGTASIHLHDAHTAKAALNKALTYYKSIGSGVDVARALMNLASVAVDIEVNAGEARRLYEQAKPLMIELGTRRQLATLYGNLGEVLRLEGNYRDALKYALESYGIFAAEGDHFRASWQLSNVAHIEILQRNYRAARSSLDDAAAHLRIDPNSLGLTWCFDVWIILAAKLECWQVAAQLLGYVETIRGELGLLRQDGMLPWLSEPIERLSKALEPHQLERLIEEGGRLTFEAAWELASTCAAPKG
ncbi:MAG: tetratricopeptide repeat protein [Candidatus Eremiobacteraeota bacterium]|nr:tetratricopeptide repeat protein [Candidatus Eremiobacteraeota bacterium]